MCCLGFEMFKLFINGGDFGENISDFYGIYIEI